MKRIIPILVAAMAVYCLWSCNEKPKHYSFVQKMSDGTEVVENIDAKNDTDAVNQYLDRMTKVIVDNIQSSDTAGVKVETMYVISPDGDTLNTKKELMQAIEMQMLEKQVPAN